MLFVKIISILIYPIKTHSAFFFLSIFQFMNLRFILNQVQYNVIFVVLSDTLPSLIYLESAVVFPRMGDRSDC